MRVADRATDTRPAREEGFTDSGQMVVLLEVVPEEGIEPPTKGL